MGTLTISRFFTLHVFLIPALIFGAVAIHIFLFRKAGAAGPPISEEKRRQLAVRPFFPGQVVKDFAFGIAIIIALTVLAASRPAALGPVANPADPTYLPRPEWYYVPVFQWLKYWQGRTSIVGIVIIPALLFLALFALPFIDRSPERRPLRRPFALASLFVVFGGLVWLGARSYAEDRRDPSVRAKLAAQEEEEQRFARAPFEPEEAGGPGGATTAKARQLTPQQSKGALLFVSESCAGCHGPEGKGGTRMFKLPNLERMYPGDQLATILRNPNATMLDGGMEPVQLKGEDFDALLAYLRALTSDRGD
jgi:ubiquinol-cytochrome c reductase cytochrome b subunit